VLLSVPGNYRKESHRHRIGLQNMPEDLPSPLPDTRDYRVGKAYWVAFFNSMIDALGAYSGMGSFGCSARRFRLYSPSLRCHALCHCRRVIPETHSGGNERTANVLSHYRLVVMMVMDIALGVSDTSRRAMRGALCPAVVRRDVCSRFFCGEVVFLSYYTVVFIVLAFFSEIEIAARDLADRWWLMSMSRSIVKGVC